MEYDYPNIALAWSDATDHGSDHNDNMDIDDQIPQQDEEPLLRLPGDRSPSRGRGDVTPTTTDWTRSSTSSVDRRWSPSRTQTTRASIDYHTTWTEPPPPVLGERVNDSVHRSHWDRGSMRHPRSATNQGAGHRRGNTENVADPVRWNRRNTVTEDEDGSRTVGDYNRMTRQQLPIPTVRYVLQHYRVLIGRREDGEPIWSDEFYTKLMPVEDPQVPGGGAVK